MAGVWRFPDEWSMGITPAAGTGHSGTIQEKVPKGPFVKGKLTFLWIDCVLE